MDRSGQGAAPIAENERIGTIDALRGFALLGILIMNMPDYGNSFYAFLMEEEQWPMWWDQAARSIADTMFSGKFNGIFTMLFAVGFTMQLQRQQQREGSGATAIYLRRLTWLFIFGLLHICLWPGDVLHAYAIAGAMFLALYRLSDRAIVGLIVFTLLYPAIEGVLLYNVITPADIANAVGRMRELVASDYAAARSGSFLATVQQSWRNMAAMYFVESSWYTIPRFFALLLTTALIGLLLGRRRFFHDLKSKLPLVARLQWWLLGTGIVLGACFALWSATVEQPQTPSLWKTLAQLCFRVSRVATMGFYMCLIIRAMHSDRWRGLMQPFVVAGRMPLTNYLMQTVICTSIFLGWGLGFYGKVGPALSMLLSLVIFFAIQVPFSRWWLGRFQMGPMEYLWRLLSYGHRESVGRLAREH